MNRSLTVFLYSIYVLLCLNPSILFDICIILRPYKLFLSLIIVIFFIQIKKMCLTTAFIEFIIVSTSNVRFKHIETLGGVHIDERETPRNNS